MQLEIGSEPAINAHVGQAFPTAILAWVEGYYDKTLDNIDGDFKAQVNWGDSPNWSNVSVVPNGSLLGSPFVLKGSHVYVGPHGQLPGRGLYHRA